MNPAQTQQPNGNSLGEAFGQLMARMIERERRFVAAFRPYVREVLRQYQASPFHTRRIDTPPKIEAIDEQTLCVDRPAKAEPKPKRSVVLSKKQRQDLWKIVSARLPHDALMSVRAIAEHLSVHDAREIDRLRKKLFRSTQDSLDCIHHRENPRVHEPSTYYQVGLVISTIEEWFITVT